MSPEEFQVEVLRRFDGMDERFDKVGACLEAVDRRVAALDGRVGELTGRVSALECSFASLHVASGQVVSMPAPRQRVSAQERALGPA